MCYVQEKDIITFAGEQAFPIIPCNLCGSQENLMRKKVANLIDQLAAENPKVPSNILHALQSLKPSQLMDQNMWNFKNLEQELISPSATAELEVFKAEEFEILED
jgi:tRNA 2-thiocytidine biosynthesis protein TtcA